MSKYSFKFRLDKTRADNYFLRDNIVYIDMQDVSLAQIVKMLNLSLSTPTKVKKPKFEIFDPAPPKSTQAGGIK